MASKDSPEPTKVSAWITAGERVLKMLHDPLTIPAAFMIFMCWLGWVTIPPLAAKQIESIDKQITMMETMDENLIESKAILMQIKGQSRPSEEFATDIHEEHMRAEVLLKDSSKKIDDIHNAVVK